MEAERVDHVTPHGCPKYLKLARGFERQLRTGVLRVGDRLPSVRQLRDEHQISAATAVGCYLWLERQGYVRAVAKAGDVVAVESPGCYEILQALESLQIRALEVPHVVKKGIDLKLLATAVAKHRVKAIVLNASCHNPLGDCVEDASKAEIVAFAEAHDIALIEGDTFGDLVFSGERPRTLKAFDKTGLVLQCQSLAHYVAPGFNLGWCNPGRWRAEVERLKAFTNVAAARLPQLALAEFLESGGFDRHVKQLRLALWRSVQATRQEVLRLFPPGTRVSQPEGGFVLWVQLPPGHDGVDVQRRAAAAGVKILSGAVFSPSRQYRTCIRIACGHPFETIKPAIRTLARLVGS